MRFQTLFWFTVAVALAAGIYYYIANWRGAVDVPIPPEAKRMPELILSDYDGKAINLSDFRGKPLLINAWASWCPFCKKELPDFAALQEEFRDRIVVVVVDRGEALETAKKYSDELGVTGKIILLLDPDDAFYKAINGFSMPETLFVDSDGFIRFHKRGPMELEEMRRRVNDLLL